MSWKMFFQIVLLIVIAVVIMLGSKCALYKAKCGFKDKMPRMHRQQAK